MAQLLHGAVWLPRNQLAKLRIALRRDLMGHATCAGISQNMAALPLPPQQSRDRRLANFETRGELRIRALAVQICLHNALSQIQG